MKLSREHARKLGLDVPPKPSKNGTKKKGNGTLVDCAKLFDAACLAHHLPVPVHEYQFAPPRKWKADYLFGGFLIVEVEGGAWTNGRHTRGQGFLDDMEKYNEMSILGFTLIRVTPEQIDDGSAFATIRRALGTTQEQS